MGEERVRRERKRDPVRTGNRCPSRLRSGSEARRGVVRRRGGGGCMYIYTNEVAWEAVAKFAADRVLAERERLLRDELHETI
jgi:hypothetical protein